MKLEYKMHCNMWVNKVTQSDRSLHKKDPWTNTYCAYYPSLTGTKTYLMLSFADYMKRRHGRGHGAVNPNNGEQQDNEMKEVNM